MSDSTIRKRRFADKVFHVVMEVDDVPDFMCKRVKRSGHDYATIQQHNDGTEFQISGNRAPASGDVCMGVWKRTGERTYKVRYIALAWASPDDKLPVSLAVFIGPSVFHGEI